MSAEEKIGGCLPRLRSLYAVLTKAEQKVADYILEYPGEVIHLSITELADAAGSAEATVFRLCQKVGFKGYQHFKIALAQDVCSPVETVYREFVPGDTADILTKKVFANISEGLQDTFKIIDNKALEQAIALLDKAARIEAYGSGGSAVIAADVEHRFMRFAVPVRAYADPHMQITAAALLQPGDVVIAISHSGSNKDLLDSVAMAKKSGAAVIAITSHMKSPLTGLADISLYGVAREAEAGGEAMVSRIIHLAIVDVLYMGMMLRRKEQQVENMQKIREAIALRRI
ncbi:MAG: MurR/RpiR family transcriptional regulator [Negativicutes bacterium]|nr:MurR/RpiR family transcriptional regulator [Negativicutes bacterium]